MSANANALTICFICTNTQTHSVYKIPILPCCFFKPPTLCTGSSGAELSQTQLLAWIPPQECCGGHTVPPALTSLSRNHSFITGQ